MHVRTCVVGWRRKKRIIASVSSFGKSFEKNIAASPFISSLGWGRLCYHNLLVPSSKKDSLISKFWTKTAKAGTQVARWKEANIVSLQVVLAWQ